MASIFTASLLPKLAQGRAADTLSSIGFAAGYGGGAIALILATSLIAARESVWANSGWSTTRLVRNHGSLVAGVFITYRVCPDD